MNYREYLAELGKMTSAFERLHFTCLVYLDNKQFDDLTFVTLIHNLFSDDDAQAWLADRDCLIRLARRITQRG